jgi:predicted transcriptional regulator
LETQTKLREVNFQISKFEELRDWSIQQLANRVEEASQEWLSHDQDDKFLMMGDLLGRVRENWQDLEPKLSATAKEFYYHSNAYEQGQMSVQETLRRKLLQTQAKLEEISLDESEIEKQIIGDYLAALEHFGQRIENSRTAAEWLKKNKEILISLLKKVAFVTLSEDFSITKAGRPVESPDKVQRFLWDIDDYIDWLYSSLELGTIIPLEDTALTPTLPSSVYATAFNFIKEKAVRDLSDGVAEELEIFLNYLINYLTQNQSNT